MYNLQLYFLFVILVNVLLCLSLIGFSFRYVICNLHAKQLIGGNGDKLYNICHK